jgi:hypothetical protein
VVPQEEDINWDFGNNPWWNFLLNWTTVS